MVATTALLKTPKILSLTRSDAQYLTPAVLLWRQKFLIVKATGNIDDKEPVQTIPALRNRQWFESCLRHSPIRAVRLDLQLGEESLNVWADACDRTGKQAFVHLPTATHLRSSRNPWLWRSKRLVDWLLAVALLAISSPVWLLLIALVELDSPGPIFFHQWRVGQRGHLFKIIKFRTLHSGSEQCQQRRLPVKDKPRDITIDWWLQKYSLTNLPQLLNVLRGEMSLIGPKPWAIEDAVRATSRLQSQMNALPGITNLW